MRKRSDEQNAATSEQLRAVDESDYELSEAMVTFVGDLIDRDVQVFTSEQAETINRLHAQMERFLVGKETKPGWSREDDEL